MANICISVTKNRPGGLVEITTRQKPRQVCCSKVLPVKTCERPSSPRRLLTRGSRRLSVEFPTICTIYKSVNMADEVENSLATLAKTSLTTFGLRKDNPAPSLC